MQLKRIKRENQFISYLIGEGETISQISQQVSAALESYNRNFVKLSLHEHKVDLNLNTLSTVTANLSSYEKHHYETQIISSLLIAGNFQRIHGNIQMGQDLTELRNILHGAGINTLLEQISDGLVKTTQVCQLQKGMCKIHSYLTQSTANNSINLHQVLKGLV